MDKFKFKLQNIFEYRKEIEEKKKEEYQKEQKNYILQQELLKNLYFEKEKAVNNKDNYRTKLDYQLLSLYIDSMNLKIEKQKIITISVERILKQKKEEFLQCTKDCKIMEKLREKAFDEFKNESDKKEQRQNDDFAIHSFIQNERG